MCNGNEFLKRFYVGEVVLLLEFVARHASRSGLSFTLTHPPEIQIRNSVEIHIFHSCTNFQRVPNISTMNSLISHPHPCTPESRDAFTAVSGTIRPRQI
jgi:hypothetical protein